MTWLGRPSPSIFEASDIEGNPIRTHHIHKMSNTFPGCYMMWLHHFQMSYFYLDSPSTHKIVISHILHIIIIIFMSFTMFLGTWRVYVYQRFKWNAAHLPTFQCHSCRFARVFHNAQLRWGPSLGTGHWCGSRSHKSLFGPFGEIYRPDAVPYGHVIMSCVESVDNDCFVGLCNRGIIRALLTICWRKVRGWPHCGHPPTQEANFRHFGLTWFCSNGPVESRFGICLVEQEWAWVKTGKCGSLNRLNPNQPVKPDCGNVFQLIPRIGPCFWMAITFITSWIIYNYIYTYYIYIIATDTHTPPNFAGTHAKIIEHLQASLRTNMLSPNSPFYQPKATKVGASNSKCVYIEYKYEWLLMHRYA